MNTQPPTVPGASNPTWLQPLLDRFFQLLDFFAQPHYGGDILQLSRARALVGTNLLVALLFALASIYVQTSHALADSSNLITGVILLPFMLCNLLIPLALRQHPCLAVGQQITLILTLIAVTTGFCITGGPVLATSSQLMILQAALALFLLGIKGGLIWSLVVLLVQLSLYAVYLLGVDFPNIQPPSAANASAIFNWLLAFFTIVGLILLIESSRGQLEVLRYIEDERLRHQANHDSLTQLANRNLFEQRLQQAMNRAERGDRQALLIYIDLDKFKPINDQWGHDAGDRVLKVIAARLNSDTRDTDLVARLGGDEFAMILPEVNTDINLEKLIGDIHRRVKQPIYVRDQSNASQHFSVDCSIGTCLYPSQADSAEKMKKFADQAMYRAKKEGRHWLPDSEQPETT